MLLLSGDIPLKGSMFFDILMTDVIYRTIYTIPVEDPIFGEQ